MSGLANGSLSADVNAGTWDAALGVHVKLSHTQWFVPGEVSGNCLTERGREKREKKGEGGGYRRMADTREKVDSLSTKQC